MKIDLDLLKQKLTSIESSIKWLALFAGESQKTLDTFKNIKQAKESALNEINEIIESDKDFKQINTFEIDKAQVDDSIVQIKIDTTETQASLHKMDNLLGNLNKAAIQSTIDFGTLSIKLVDLNQDVFTVSEKIQSLNNELTKLTKLTEKLTDQKEYIVSGPNYKMLSVLESSRNVDKYIGFALGASVGTSCLILVATACHHFG